MEDVEYLYLLAEIGRSADARRLCREVVISADVFWMAATTFPPVFWWPTAAVSRTFPWSRRLLCALKAG